jgi:hypothetical protein
MDPNPTKLDPAGRGDHPSGRQAAKQPEHTGKENTAPESLHQGQAPDFQTQDKTVREENPGVKGLMDTSTPKSPRQKDAAQHEQKNSPIEKEANATGKDKNSK